MEIQRQHAQNNFKKNNKVEANSLCLTSRCIKATIIKTIVLALKYKKNSLCNRSTEIEPHKILSIDG